MESTNKKWYVIHTYSGYENRVTANLERKIQSLGMEHEIFRTLVPVDIEVEITKDGTKKEKKKKRYPGYVFVEMIHTDRSWYVVRNTPGVTGFVGSGNKPVPLTDAEVTQMLKEAGLDETTKPKVQINLKLKEVVKIIDGPMRDFTAVVTKIDEEKGRVKVLVTMFGRDTETELDVNQLIKLD